MYQQPLNRDENVDPVFATDIAITGMACRFAGATDLQDYWSNLRNGIQSVAPLSDEALLAAGVDPAMLRHPNYVRSCAPLPGMEMFDATLFGLSPRDASIMDPQHRHFLQCAWAALEDAGHVPDRFDGAIGVFAGSGHNAYLPSNLLTNPELVRDIGLFLLRHTGNDKDFLTTRASYLLDLKGPSINVQTACSTSLVAIHMAAQSLINGESDMALAGGVTIELPHGQGYLFEPGEILSPDGSCRTFDASAAGTVFGSGVGVVVLRRLADAISDGDHIYAVIKGSAINNDGLGKVSYLAPSVDGQSRVITEALSVCDVTADSISYVEAHGTGTPIGDPIEVAALTQAFRQDTTDVGFCGIGSVKPNIGHTDTAAGVASIIKVAMALHKAEMPPSLNFERPNPACGFESSPFYVNTRLRDWERRGKEPRRAGVSSLGVGGTNSHVVLEEAPARGKSGPSRPFQLFLLSAATPGALERNAQGLAQYLRSAPSDSLADCAYTLGIGRKALRYRRAVVARDAVQAAQDLMATEAIPQDCTDSHRKLTFMFAGGGAQYAGMAHDLYRSEKVFRESVDECLSILLRQCGVDIREALFPANDRPVPLDRPARALPALFTIQYAMARLWMAWGVEPESMIGHSMGEYVAAHLAGVFDLQSALRLVSGRGKLFETVAGGRMLSVCLSEEALRPYLEPTLSVAAVNAPNLTVASGPDEAIARLEATLQGLDISAQLVPIGVAAHSMMLDPILGAFRDLVRSVRLNAPTLPFISSLTGDWVKAEMAMDPEYWVRHLRETVRFSSGISRLMETPGRVLLEVGPGRTLASLARQNAAQAKDCHIFNSLRHPDEQADDLAYALDILGRLWTVGVPCRLDRFWNGEHRLRVSLPSYSFEQQRHWIEPGRGASKPGISRLREARSSDIADWFYAPTWHRTARVTAQQVEGPALVFLDKAGLGKSLAAKLRSQGCEVITVERGRHFRRKSPQAYVIRPDSADDYRSVLAEMAIAGSIPTQIYHMFLVTGAGQDEDISLREGFHSLIFLAQAMAEEIPDQPVTIMVIADGMQRILAEPARMPAKAAVLGACRVIPSEFSNITVRSIDIDIAPSATPYGDSLIGALVSEAGDGDSVEEVAYRGSQRWVQRMERSAVPARSESPTRLRLGGTYLITGGTGGIGLTLARFLSEKFGARVALLSRTPLPPRETWPSILASHSPANPLCRRLREIRALEDEGAELLLIHADVTDRRSMRRAVRRINKAFGPLHGVFHTAGVLDDGLIQLKTAQRATAVLAPKIKGTLALEAALASEQPDFVMLFSSISAFAGLAGQADYAGANAFLDAYAQSRLDKGGTRILSAAWPQWREVGMAAALAERSAIPWELLSQMPIAPARHPLLDNLVHADGNMRIFTARLSPDSHWLLDEHRLASGQALVPGTGYLEIARAAFADIAGDRAIELREVSFLSPFAVADGGARDLAVCLRRDGGTVWHFSIVGRSSDTPDREEWIPHCQGFIGIGEDPRPERMDAPGIAERCEISALASAAEASESHLRFGPRWNNIEELVVGQGEALISLRLPEAFCDDLQDIGLHPALMDLATAGAQMLVRGFEPQADFFAPVSYDRIIHHSPLPAALKSHVRLRPDGDQGNAFAIFDVTLLASDGTVLGEISGFRMMRITDPAVLAGGRLDKAVTTTNVTTLQPKADSIAPKEGMQVIERILAGDPGAHVVIAPYDIDDLLTNLRDAQRSTVRSEQRHADDYSADDEPRTAVERTIAELWSEMLGIDSIRRTDDFFQLGGHSLLAIQFMNRLKKRLGKSLSATSLLQAPTVELLAELLDPQAEKAEDADDAAKAIKGLVEIRPGGAKPPLFLVHDGLGETLLYRTLAMRLDPGQAVIGLQPEMTSSGGYAHTSIDEMARAYVRRVQALQPEGPYLLAGLCAGGVIAFEMARQLEDDGQHVGFVGILDAADVEAMERPFIASKARLRRLLGLLTAGGKSPRDIAATTCAIFTKLFNAAAYELNSRIDRIRTRRTVDRMREGVAGEAKPLSFLQLYEEAHRQHRPSGLLQGGRVALFRASQGNGAGDDAPYRDTFSDHLFGWGKRVAGPIAVADIPGGHTSLLQEPHVGSLAAAMQVEIDASLQAAAFAAPGTPQEDILSPQESSFVHRHTEAVSLVG